MGKTNKKEKSNQEKNPIRKRDVRIKAHTAAVELTVEIGLIFYISDRFQFVTG